MSFCLLCKRTFIGPVKSIDTTERLFLRFVWFPEGLALTALKNPLKFEKDII